MDAPAPQHNGEPEATGPETQQLKQVEDMLVRAIRRAFASLNPGVRVARKQGYKGSGEVANLSKHIDAAKDYFQDSEFLSSDFLRWLADRGVQVSMSLVWMGRVLAKHPEVQRLSRSRRGVTFRFK